MLFIDTRNLGHMISRTMKEFSDEDIAKIADCVHRFQNGEQDIDTIGFCKVASLEEIRAKKHFSVKVHSQEVLRPMRSENI